MKKDEIKKQLSKHKNVLELVRAANELKQSGESEIMVNRCVAELRKEMLANSSEIKRLTRIAIADTPMDEFGVIPFQVDNIHSPCVVYDGENVLM